MLGKLGVNQTFKKGSIVVFCFADSFRDEDSILRKSINTLTLGKQYVVLNEEQNQSDIGIKIECDVEVGDIRYYSCMRFCRLEEYRLQKIKNFLNS
jgi:hypothetical protein